MKCCGKAVLLGKKKKKNQLASFIILEKKKYSKKYLKNPARITLSFLKKSQN